MPAAVAGEAKTTAAIQLMIFFFKMISVQLTLRLGGQVFSHAQYFHKKPSLGSCAGGGGESFACWARWSPTRMPRHWFSTSIRSQSA